MAQMEDLDIIVDDLLRELHDSKEHLEMIDFRRGECQEFIQINRDAIKRMRRRTIMGDVDSNQISIMQKDLIEGEQLLATLEADHKRLSARTEELGELIFGITGQHFGPSSTDRVPEVQRIPPVIRKSRPDSDSDDESIDPAPVSMISAATAATAAAASAAASATSATAASATSATSATAAEAATSAILNLTYGSDQSVGVGDYLQGRRSTGRILEVQGIPPIVSKSRRDSSSDSSITDDENIDPASASMIAAAAAADVNLSYDFGKSVGVGDYLQASRSTDRTPEVQGIPPIISKSSNDSSITDDENIDQASASSAAAAAATDAADAVNVSDDFGKSVGVSTDRIPEVQGITPIISKSSSDSSITDDENIDQAPASAVAPVAAAVTVSYDSHKSVNEEQKTTLDKSIDLKPSKVNNNNSLEVGNIKVAAKDGSMTTLSASSDEESVNNNKSLEVENIKVTDKDDSMVTLSASSDEESGEEYSFDQQELSVVHEEDPNASADIDDSGNDDYGEFTSNFVRNNAESSTLRKSK